jgi:ornithine carbamoyltransferase
MADLLWMLERSPEGLAGKRVAVTWAYSPSYAKPLSVPQGLVTLLTRYGADVVLAHPRGYPLLEDRIVKARAFAQESGGSFHVTESMDEAFKGADFVYPKSWGPLAFMQERQAASKAGDKEHMKDIEHRALANNAVYRDWICDERRMALTKGGDALYMHCLPADIGDEVTPSVMRKARVDVARQANYKLYVIMALIAAAKIEDLPRRLEEMAS